MSEEEYKKWCTNCEFIQASMQYYSFKDFVRLAHRLKEEYKLLDYYGKVLYRWYVYAKLMRYEYKNLIWDYLNDYSDIVPLLIANGSSKLECEQEDIQEEI